MDYAKLNIPEKQQQALKEFIEIEIPNTKFWKPDGKPKKEWKVFYAETWGAAWDVALDAANDAAWDAASDSKTRAVRGAARDAARDAVRDAAWGAARDAVRDAAWDRAWDAAWDAAWDRAWDAASDAVRDAAWGAAFQTYFIITADLDYKDKEKHTKYAKDLWEIYQKGYGCICDVNGVFYVYAIGKPKKRGKKLQQKGD
jgi:hypothetical protein